MISLTRNSTCKRGLGTTAMDRGVVCKGVAGPWDLPLLLIARAVSVLEHCLYHSSNIRLGNRSLLHYLKELIWFLKFKVPLLSAVILGHLSVMKMLINRIRNQHSSGKVFYHLCAPIRNIWKPLLVDTGIERVLLSRNFQCGSDFMVIHKREGKYFALKLNSFFISFSLILHFSVAHIPAF